MTLCELTVKLRARKIISYISARTFNAAGNFNLAPGNDRNKVCLTVVQYIIFVTEPWEISIQACNHSFQRWVGQVAQNRTQYRGCW